ncbi:MAG TPA: VWA domain-containing protein [Pyrinomonadaceae bacterium]
MNYSKHTFRRVTLLLCMLLSAYSSVPLTGTIAQNSTGTPSLAETAAEVNRAGYLLKPIGLATGEWPKVRLDFSIERSDHSIFRNLNLADVQPKLDGEIVAPQEGDLKLTDSQGSAVFVLLDASGSMSGHGVDKLRAAKEGLSTLIDNLRPNDRVGLIVFDEEPRTILPVTADKELIKREIANFQLRKDKSKFTRLYDAVDHGLKEAIANGVQNLLLISDGWEDTPESRQLLANPTALEAYKRGREEQITQLSRVKNVRVFTVAIGDEQGRNLSYVDRAALQNISKGTNGGVGDYIELKETAGAEQFQQQNLLGKLQQTLNELRKSFGYTYSLTLNLNDRPRDLQRHKLWVGFTVGDNPRIQLPVEYGYSWPATGPPKVETVIVAPPIFIQSASRNVKWQQLLMIYVPLLAILLVLTSIPSVVRRVVGSGQSSRLHKSIVVVGDRSPLIGSVCPNEGSELGRTYLIKEGDVVLICPNPGCKTPHHLSCWRFNEHHCMKRTCELEMVIPTNLLEKYGLS